MPGVATKIFTTVAGFLGGGVVAKIVAGVVTTGAVLAGQKLLGKIMAPDVSDMGVEGISIRDNAPSNTAPIPVIYGRRQVGGSRVFITTTGQDNKFLHLVLAICEGEVSELHQIYINDVALYNADGSINEKFRGGDENRAYIKVNFHTGADDQVADSDLKASTYLWGDNHTLSGICYAYVRLEYNTEIWSSGLPIINFDISGKKVNDIRNTADDANGLFRFSSNPALCIRDYLINSRYGRSIATSEIDDTSFIAAANYCDESITIDTGTQLRYGCNGVVNTDASSIENLTKMLTSCRGFLIYTGGKYKLVLDKIDSSTFAFTADNMIGDVSMSIGSKSTLWNRCKANFFNSEKEWANDYAIEDSATYRAADNDLLLEGSIELPFTSDQPTAKMIARQAMNQSRESIMVTFKATIEALQVECGDVVTITSDSFGWSTKKFRILEISMDYLDEITFTAREYSDNVYSLSDISIEALTDNNTDLPDLSAIKPVKAFTVSEELLFDEPTLTNRITIDWDKPEDIYIKEYIVSFKKANQKKTKMLGTTESTEFIVDNLSPGRYFFYVRAVNRAGIQSKGRRKVFRVRGTSVLPKVNPPAITNITESLYVSTTGSGVKARATMNFTASSGNTDWEALGVEIDEYKVQFKLESESRWQSPGTTSGNFFEFNDIAPGVYDFRIRAKNDANVYSSWAATSAEISGLTDPPANVNNFFLRTDSLEAHLRWDLVDDVDVNIGGHYEIRHNKRTSGAYWKNSRKLRRYVAGNENGATVPLLKGTYFIKAVDSTGHKSSVAATVVNTITPSLFDKLTTNSHVESFAETAWAGTKTDMVIDYDDNTLKLESAIDIDDVTDSIDDWAVFDSLGKLEKTGSYEFTTYVDFGQQANLGLLSEDTWTVNDISGLFDNRSANCDAWADFDNLDDFDDAELTLYYASTNDNPASSPSWSGWQEFTYGTVYGRAFKFKVDVSTQDSTHQIKISELSAKIEAWYRFNADRLTSSTSAYAVTFDDAFKATDPSVAITAQDMNTGDYYAVSSVSATGFTINFYNSSGTGVARTFDYLARGY
jgi:predicted phage tail protein